jgi:taurine--2-oxoglutarate transaminase
MTERQFADKCLQQIEEVLMYEGAHTIAAFMLETVTGTNGIIVPPGEKLCGFDFVCLNLSSKQMVICKE